MKKLLLVVLGLVGVLVAALAAVMVPAFLGSRPTVEGAVAPGVQLVKDGFVNAFLVDLAPGTVALVDCGQDPEAKALKAALAARGLGATAVQHIFLTHGHGDHVGGCQAFPAATMHGFEADRGLIEGTARAHGPVTGFMSADPARRRPLGDALVDGATLTLDGVPVRAWNVPGHTGGSAAFLIRGVLFLGDSAAGTADGRLKLAPWAFSDDLDRCRQSLRALGATLGAEHLQVSALAFAHSGWLDGATAAASLERIE
jgi:glyoxylase-like metal-dependent hydrolase (beta-lactamase superfamily II)